MWWEQRRLPGYSRHGWRAAAPLGAIIIFWITCTLSPSHSFSPSFLMKTGIRLMAKPWKKRNTMPVWFIDHLVLMKLQTRVRQMLQLHFSSSKPTSFCVKSLVAPSPAYPLAAVEAVLCHTEEAGEAKEPCAGQGQMAEPSAEVWRKQSSSAEAPGTGMTGGFPAGMFPEPSAAQCRAPLVPPCHPSEGFLPWCVHCPDTFPVWKLHLYFFSVFHLSLALLVGYHK